MSGMLVRRLAFGALLVGVATYALQGGEYGTTDLRQQRHRRAGLNAQIDSLQSEVDSLRRLEKQLATDPELQERIAREEFGLVRGEKELLYRIVDSADRSRKGLTR